MNTQFWNYLQQLVDSNQIIIDRPKGSTHPRYKGKEYPVDYGFLKGTTTVDMGGVDIWQGTLGEHEVVGVLLTVDLHKKDTELKILFDCTQEEIQSIIHFINSDQMQAIYLKKEVN